MVYNLLKENINYMAKIAIYQNETEVKYSDQMLAESEYLSSIWLNYFDIYTTSDTCTIPYSTLITSAK